MHALARHLIAGEQAQEDALNHLAAVRQKLDQLRQAELQNYADAVMGPANSEGMLVVGTLQRLVELLRHVFDRTPRQP